MKKCTACNVQVDTPLERCPLCYTTLVQHDDKMEMRTYPDLSSQEEGYNLLLRIFLFISISSVGISIVVNLLNPTKYPWSLIVTVSIIYVWMAIGTAVRRRHKIGFNLMIQLGSLIALFLVLGKVMSFLPFVFTYLIPALIGSAIFSFNVLAIINRKNLESFILYFLIVAVMGFVPLAFYVLHWSTALWPAVVCAVYSGVSILSVFLFAYRITKTELSKRFKL